MVTTAERRQRRGPVQMVTELAKCAWLVEIHLMISESQSDTRFFAVGAHEARDAEEAILRYPGIVQDDKRNARRRLSDVEIVSLKLREGGVRPYSGGRSEN
jgi:hypothetical protein